jgi:MATE family multidrug resistance protein
MLQIRRAWVAEARTLAGISLSITATMFAQLAISAVETLIVARLGVHVLAGVTLALSVYLLVFLFALGVVTAVTPIVAQAHGRGDAEGLRLSGQQGLWVGLTFSIPGVALLVGFSSIIELAFGKKPEAVSASDYLLGAAWGLPAWVCYVAVRSLAVATGRVRITTIIMLASIPVHAGLTWWLVFGGFGLPPLGALGAGFAYSLTAFGAWGLLLAIVRTSPVDAFGSVFRRPFVWDGERYRRIMWLGVPFSCRIMLREGVLPAAAFALAPYGAAAVAAHAVAAQVISLAGVFSFGFSDAANMRVSYALGAGIPHRARHSGWIAIQLATAISALLVAALVTEPTLIARWVLGDNDPGSVAAAAKLLPVAACLLFLEGVQSAAGGALSGMQDAKGPLLIAIIGSWAVGMPLAILLAWMTATPALGFWIGLVIGGCLTTILYLIRFRQKIALQQRMI